MEFIFWGFFMLIFYCYFGYAIFIFLIAKFFPKNIKKTEFMPHVSIIVTVWNEEDVIKRKIENLLSLDYPVDKVEILIGSDGSDDKTNEIIRSFDDKRIRFFQNEKRRGKMVVLNELAGESNGTIFLFTDARQDFDINVMKEIVCNFSDPAVGSVSGELILRDKGRATAKGIGLYWRYEKFLRKNESFVHSMLGATGAIYAVRRELFTEIPSDIVLDDMFVPFNVIKKGYRAVFDSASKAYDDVADRPEEENRRKVRTLYGNYQIISEFRYLLNPLKSPIAIQFFSHKVLRLFAPFFLIFLLLVNCFLVGKHFYADFFVFQMIFYIMALVGYSLSDANEGLFKVVSDLCYVPYVFCLLNFAALMGFFRFIFSKQDVKWEKARIG